MLETATVMMTVIHQCVTMMVEIAVDHVWTKSTAPLVLVLMEDRAMALSIQWLEMATVTMDLTMLNVTMMVKIVVDLLQIQIFVLYASVNHEIYMSYQKTLNVYVIRVVPLHVYM